MSPTRQSQIQIKIAGRQGQRGRCGQGGLHVLQSARAGQARHILQGAAPKKDVAGSPEVLPQLGRVTTEAMK